MSILGILGGGHLARLTTQTAQRLGLNVAVLDKNENSPAAQVTAYAIQGDWNDLELVGELAQSCDVITPETAAVPVDVLSALEAQGRIVRPSAKTISLVRDRLTLKSTLNAAGIATVPYAPVSSLADAEAFAAAHGYPLVLKTRLGGYDNKGNAFVPSPGELPAAFARIEAQGQPMLVERYESFYRELCVVGVRGQDGAVRLYPVSEFRAIEGVVYNVNTPAADRYAALIAERGREEGAHYFADIPALATAIAERFEVIGAFGVELFETLSGKILVNDVAPHPSVSAHYTLDACETSLYENHVRALLGLPLGWTDLTAKAAVTVSLVGRNESVPGAHEFSRALSIRGAHVHWYGKPTAYRLRRLGHVTAMHDTDPEAERIASMVATHLLGW